MNHILRGPAEPSLTFRSSALHRLPASYPSPPPFPRDEPRYSTRRVTTLYLDMVAVNNIMTPLFTHTILTWKRAVYAAAVGANLKS